MNRSFIGNVNDAALCDAHEEATREKLDRHLAHMDSRLKSNVKRWEITVESYHANDEAFQAYLIDWQESVSRICFSELDSIIENKKAWDATASGLGIEGKFAQDFLHHCSIASDKCSSFEGRGELVEEAMGRIMKPLANGDDELCGIALSIIGVSGSGNT
jgi:hypothetical protein